MRAHLHGRGFMKSSIVLGLGIGAALAGAGLAPDLASDQRRAPVGAGSRFEARVRGAVSDNPGGRAVVGAVGEPGEAGSGYTITLGGESGAIVLTRLLGGEPGPGRYPIGESAALDSAGGFRALYLPGGAARPEGVFRGDRGTLEIVAARAGELSGRLEFQASGFLADAPEDETRRVAVTGSFSGTRRMRSR